ncbi:HlyD family efflux transporter periplasmic adaptor subunit [Dictyobacter formicarum]|uniref:Multidrug efflux protein n=1 Tax=Dictyobacter formicarum TaxID=2778368 RepID=A0ABQ3VIY0_9CHLR|nr:HlyD family efflux transporter periplasmic adaptor subunit [Dictyobacter formicarum]GHO85644.1 multidrug efflux protein [Dictyobacter formicarum]
MRRMIFVPILVMIAILAIAGGVGYWLLNNYNYYQTDDAQVSGHILSVSSPQAGQLATMSVKLGDKVTAGEVIGTMTTAPVAPALKAATIKVTSPIDGAIVQANGVQGQSVTPGATLAQVADLNDLTIMAYVDEGAIHNVKLNQDVDVTIDAYSGTAYKGHVQNIVSATAGSFSLLPSSDNASGNFTKVSQRIPVVISLGDNGGNNIVPGMSAEVTIHLH